MFSIIFGGNHGFVSSVLILCIRSLGYWEKETVHTTEWMISCQV